MKKLLFLSMILGLMNPAQAQLFSRESVGGAALGGLAGGIIGHNNRGRTAEGIAIGAGAGLLLGAVAGQTRRAHQYHYQYHSYHSSAPYYYDDHASPVYIAPAPVYAAPLPAYTYYRPRPNYTVTGAALGGIAGGIIGHNNGRKTAEGVAIGAGAGLLLGAMAEQDARRRETIYVPPRTDIVYPAAPAVSTVQSQSAAPAVAASPTRPATVVKPNNDSASSMNSANALFGR